jgi:Uma2 family endonuclease
MYDEWTEDEVMEGLVPGDTRLTYDDFLHFPDDGKRHEIIDGVHYVTPSPRLGHQVLVGRLYFEIESWLRQHPGAGAAFLSPLDVIFTKWDIVEPDLLFVAADQQDILTDKNVQGPPALVIEVASPGTRKRDEGIKQRLFDRGGVREYWLVDSDRHHVRVWRRQPNGSFDRVADLRREEQLTTPLMPELTIQLAELFA